MHAPQNLMRDPALRSLRKAQKEQAVLRFLRQHIWSTQDILQQVMGLASRQAAHKSLTKLEKQGLLRRHQYETLGGRLTVWGITIQGQAHAFDVGSETPITAYFEPSRVSEQTIHHQLDLQKLRLAAERSGWTKWVDGDRLNIQDKNFKRPDAIARHPSGSVVAIECERTFKSLKRYEQILIHYLKLIKGEQIHEVIWISPSEDMAKRLQAIITSITEVRIQGQKVLIDSERHHAHLHFCSYDQWKNFTFQHKG